MRAARPAVILAAVVLATACASEPEPAASPVATASPTAAGTPACEDRTGAGFAVAIEMKDFSFTPTCLIVTKDQGLSLKNTGAALHNLTIPDTMVDIDTEAGAENNTEAIGQVVTSGTHRFFCKYHEARGMAGQIIVR